MKTMHTFSNEEFEKQRQIALNRNELIGISDI